MDVDIYTNHLPGGWDARLLEQGLGGSEEAVALLARELARRGLRVTVYASLAEASFTLEGVRYRPREAFQRLVPRDVLVGFKSPELWVLPVKAERRLHWSSDVEPAWKPAFLQRVHALVLLSQYHARRMAWVPEGQRRVLPHGIAPPFLPLPGQGSTRPEEREPLLLYCSSPDRGLERLLLDWPLIRERHPGLHLAVAYGFGRIAPGPWRERVQRLLEQPGVAWLGCISQHALAGWMARARYWCLPLERPDSELFCLSAVKAQALGALPVVQHVPGSGLGDTVRRFIPYGEFLRGTLTVRENPAAREDLPLTWERVVEWGWLPLLQDGAAQDEAGFPAPGGRDAPLPLAAAGGA